ncbi:MAG: phosphatidylinositol mannoside acyltransferase [Acidimicrobiales bacterium]|nr:phosphatidylinositol mannoside acyltransferase [Acidimicrobiales bacterium]MDG2216903.1 phosphatidylinositol mannoside acyltransferase [Acidimicrobiales bacterium]
MASASVYKAGSRLARLAPDAVGAGAARLIGAGVGPVSGDKGKIVARNIERALGRPLSAAERRRKVNQTFEWYARYYVESFKLPSIPVEQLDHEFSYEGVDTIHAHCGEGKGGAILALPHLGTWEWAAFWLARVADVKVTAIVEPLDPPELFDWFVGLRESLGMEIHPLGPDAGRQIISALKRGHLVCLLCDRDLQGTGVPVDFFGERTTLPGGPATIALRTGVPLIPAAVFWREHARHGLARPPLVVEREGRLRDDVQRVTQMIANEFEQLIRMAPEQWHLLSPNWPSDYEALGLDMPDHLRELA